MPLKLITLNVEGDKHFDCAIPFLQAEQADVVCLQEVFQADLSLWEQALSMSAIYAPVGNFTVPNRYGIAPRGQWGLVLFSRGLVTSSQIDYYVTHEGQLPVFIDGQPNSVNRALITADLQKDGVTYTVATTHFTWSSQGLPNAEQRRDLVELQKYLDQLSDYILCGDFNMPRGKEMYALLTEGLVDHLPLEVTSTIDPYFHYAGNLEIVVDSILSTPEYVSQATRVVDGVSDHQAVIGEMSRI